MQGEVVESEDTVLENSLTYKKMCVCGCVAWVEKGKVGGRGEGVERDVDQLPPHHRLLPKSVGRGRAKMGTPEPYRTHFL